MKPLFGVGLILVFVAALAVFTSTFDSRQEPRMVCFDNVQGFRHCVSAQPRCTTDTDCMEKFGGDGSPRSAR